MSDSCRSRRTFLRQSTCLAASLAAFGLPPDEAWGLTVNEIQGAAQGADRRYPVPAADGVSIDRDAQVILVRHRAQVFALALACPHQNAAVRWMTAESQFECTKHHSKYDADGRYLSGRATRNLDRFPIRRDAQGVIVDTSRVWQADRNPSEWAAAVATVGADQTELR